MRELVSALPDLGVLVKDAVHRADGAVIQPFVKQGGIDLRRRLVHEPVGAQEFEHGLFILQTQRARRRGSAPGFAGRKSRPEAIPIVAGAGNRQG